MKQQSKANKVIDSMLWRFAERIGAKGVSFLVSLVLARLLVPEVYGQIALITVITNLLEVFVDSGMGVALIQKKDADDLDFSSVFYFNVVLCIILYILMFVLAPYIAEFYHSVELIPVIRVQSIILLISGLKNVQQAYVSRTMAFKRFFFSTLGGTLGAAALGIALAYMGFGIWALVAQSLFNTLIDTSILWITVEWRPKRMFSFARLCGLLSFGWKILLSKLVDSFFGDLESLVMGKVYTSSDLAYYNRSRTFPQLLVMNINASMDSVLFTAMSEEQDNTDRVRDMTRRSIQTSSYILFPVLIGLFVVSPFFIRLLLTEKWMPCVLYVRIFCIAYLFYPINAANINAIRAIGRSDLYLKLNVIKKIIAILVLLLVIRLGPESLAIGYLLTSILGQMINAIPNKKILSYDILDQIRDIFSSAAMSATMGIAVYVLSYIGLNDFLTMTIQIFGGGLIYWGLSVITKNKTYYYLKSALLSKFNK